MSDFKFACPVCGQHITADRSTSGSELECPTCFRRMIVPQAPESGDTNLVISAALPGAPRTTAAEALRAGKRRRKYPLLQTLISVVSVLVLLGAAAATAYWYAHDVTRKAKLNRPAQHTTNAPGLTTNTVNPPAHPSQD